MLYSIDGRIMELENGFPERRINSLTFQTRDSAFPVNAISSGSILRIYTSSPQNMIVNYGDGTVKSVASSSGLFGVCNGTFEGTIGFLEQHVFLDTENNGSLRNITFEFEDIKSITRIDSFYTVLYGSLPVELSLFSNINRIDLNRSSFLLGIPNQIASLPSLTTFQASSAFSNKLEKIPEGFLNSSLSIFTFNSGLDLSDVITSDFFKINFLSNTLTGLRLRDCEIKELPSSFEDLQKLELIDFVDNDFIDFPQEISKLKNLEVLRIGSSLNKVFNLPNFYENINITNILLVFDSFDFNNLSLKWVGLKKLKTIELSGNFLINNQVFDEFIDEFYLLTIQNAYLDSNTIPPEEDYPNQFRDISWGTSARTQTGKIEAPPGFDLGVSNGNPQNQGQKIYVLVNNYGHNITTSGNFN